MSYTFTLTGHGSNELHADFYPPIELDAHKQFALALIGFHAYHSIPNVDNDTNKFYYHENDIENSIILPTGSYELSDIEKFLQEHLILKHDDLDSDYNSLLSLKPNNNTLKCEISSKFFDIDFRPEDSIGKMLGYSNKLLPHGDIIHTSDYAVEIIKVATIRLECNLVVGSYYQGRPTHTLFEFSPTVPPGYAINIEPNNLIYLPVHKQRIDNITISLLDQHSRPVNFRDEEIIIRLELKQIY